MKLHRPSPALVVSILALVVALTGTAVATTHYLITSTSQIKDGAITGKDIRSGTITSRQLSSSLQRTGFAGSSVGDATSAGGGAASAGGGTAIEAHRLAGPDLPKGGKATIATLGLAPGAYAIFAKVNMTPNITEGGLLNTLFKNNKTVIGSCTLDVDGTGDYSAGALVSPGSQNPLTLATQVTRTLDHTGTATLTCQEDSGVAWHAADASIVAVKVDQTTRTESTP